jgi:hypothetical protein
MKTLQDERPSQEEGKLQDWHNIDYVYPDGNDDYKKILCKEFTNLPEIFKEQAG